MDSSFLSNGFCKMGKVERKKWNEKSGTKKVERKSIMNPLQQLKRK